MAFGAGVSGIVDRVAIGAGCIFMRGTISVAAAGMVEGRVPIVGIVALGTVTTNSTMGRRCIVTGSAGCREPAVNAAGMTLRATQAGMCAGQRESGDGMIETGRGPAAG